MNMGVWNRLNETLTVSRLHRTERFPIIGTACLALLLAFAAQCSEHKPKARGQQLGT